MPDSDLVIGGSIVLFVFASPEAEIVDEPGAGEYYGGAVAAPVFSNIVGGALRLLAVPPDAPVREEGEATRQVANR